MELIFRKASRQYGRAASGNSINGNFPAAYTADETKSIFYANAGDLVGPTILRVATAFDGTGGRTVSLGDTGDTDRFLTTTNGDLSATALVQGTGGSGSVYTAIGRHLYTAAIAIDAVFVAATGASPTIGQMNFHIYIARVSPH